MSKVKAVLFDMDGVLIDAKDWHYEALNRALAIFGMEISRYDHLVTYDGLPTKKKLEMLSKERGLPRDLHSFLNDLKQQYTFELIHQKCKPVFKHQYALSKLKQEGYKIAVCSNSIRKTIELMMEKADLTPYLDLIVSNQDVKNGKPNPEIYLKAMTHFDLKPEQCLILEDNQHGIEAAIASGGHLLKIETVNDVNIANIHNRLKNLAEGKQ
ncbi:MAG: HAD family phosphatase [Bdellovibrionales bacterium]|nr:HAD family phosphatase [Bdellovibrionales bacterium]